MKPRDLVDLLLLAALWGASFLFMRLAAPEFGPIALIEVRLGIAAAFLLVVLGASRKLALLRPHAGPLTALGVINSALPFCLFAYATLSVTSGFAAILNATAPSWGALVAYLWLKDRLSASRLSGLAIGLAGAAVLVWDKASFEPGGSGLAVAAGLLGSLSYGVAANYATRRLSGVDPLAVATGSQVGAAIVLLPLALASWPAGPVSMLAWASVVVMGVASTGLAYILYFRLIANVGPARAIAVTFLVPVFATLWGNLLLDEAVSGRMLLGGGIVLLGTALSTGLLRFGRAAAPLRADRTTGPDR